MAKQYVFTEGDYRRIEKVVRFVERHLIGRPILRRRPRPIQGPAPDLPVRAKTQEAAQADEFISVKLLDSEGAETGDAFDAECQFVDNATVASGCTPQVKSGVIINVQRIDGAWYIVYPTFTLMDICT